MRKTVKEIREALSRGNYKEAYRLCERARAGEEPPPEIFFLGAGALFGLGHIHQAEEWVREHGRLTNQGPEFLYLQAYLHLHKRNFKEALLDWTRILQLDPSRTLADDLIDKLKDGEDRVFREISNPENFSRFIPLGPGEPGVATRKHENDRRVVTPNGAPDEAPEETSASQSRSSTHSHSHSQSDSGFVSRMGRRAIVAVLFFAGAGIILGLVIAYVPGVSGMLARFSPKGKTKFNGRMDLPDAPTTGTIIPPEKFGDAPPRFVYASRDDVLKEFRNARSLVIKGSVNQARYLLGKIELSNAGFEIKERAILLRDVIPDVQRERFRDPVEISAVNGEPYLFRGAQVLWTGKVRGPRVRGKDVEFILEQNKFEQASIRVRAPLRRRAGVGKSAEDLKDGESLRVYGIFREKSADGNLIVEALELLGSGSVNPGTSK